MAMRARRHLVASSKTSVSLKGSRYFSFHTFYHLARSVCFVVALFFQGGFLYLYVQVGVCEREADVQARQRYHLVCLIDIVHPSPMLFAVYLHFSRFAIDKDVFFHRRQCEVILEFPRPIRNFSAWREDFENYPWRLEKVTCSSVAWIAGDGNIGMEVAFLRNLHFDV